MTIKTENWHLLNRDRVNNSTKNNRVSICILYYYSDMYVFLDRWKNFYAVLKTPDLQYILHQKSIVSSAFQARVCWQFINYHYIRNSIDFTWFIYFQFSLCKLLAITLSLVCQWSMPYFSSPHFTFYI